MTSIFLQMPMDPEDGYTIETFKARYFELTGENVAKDPDINVEETHCIIGSDESRLSQAVADQLAFEFPMVVISARGAWPAGWESKYGQPGG